MHGVGVGNTMLETRTMKITREGPVIIWVMREVSKFWFFLLLKKWIVFVFEF